MSFEFYQGEYAYLQLLKQCLNRPLKQDRTGTGTHSMFGHQLRFDLRNGFPLLTTKKVNFRAVVAELLWFLSGDTNVKTLQRQGVNIWNADAARHGSDDLGPIYGKQWRDFGGVDQIQDLIHQIKTNPDSRRLIVSAWNPPELPAMALPPCHVMFQMYVDADGLSCLVYQRSADVFLGLPFNIASYALLTRLIALECDLQVKELIWTGGDCHLYANHVDQAREQLTRSPRPLPLLYISKNPIFGYHTEDMVLTNYDPYPAIKAPLSVGV